MSKDQSIKPHQAIVYLAEAPHVTGEVLHVDAVAHNGKW